MNEIQAFPRTRGGDPQYGRIWSYSECLFPAHAGVIPSNWGRTLVPLTFPRTRGGDPQYGRIWSYSECLFPAHAGVILKVRGFNRYGAPFPRTRGGDPIARAPEVTSDDFSPHTRG